MALMSLALLTALMLGLASLAEIEPVIAANHLRGSQARMLAESGLEYALWALSNPTHPAGLPSGLPDVVAAPFDGLTFVALGQIGGFTVKVANDPGGDPARRTIRAVGWTPTNSIADPRPKAHRKISADAAAVPLLGARAPCALCVRGALTVAGNVAVDGRNANPACGGDTKYGTFSRDATTLSGPVSVSGGAGAAAEHQAVEAFDPVILSPGALDALKTLAWRNGTYYGPGFARGGIVPDGQATWPGRIVFDASNPVPDGIIFIDTTDGANVGGGGPFTTLATARLDTGAFGNRPGGFRGWLVVNGALEIAASLNVTGLVYAVDGLTYQAPGAARIDGLVTSLNLRPGSQTRIEPVSGGDLAVTFDCGHAGGAGLVPHGYRLIPGTYREDTD